MSKVAEDPNGEPRSGTSRASWKEIVARYQRPKASRATWQILNTLLPYAALWCLMYWSLSVSFWLTAPLVLLAGAFLVRIFIIFHDCSHSSFFKAPWANTVLGFCTGVLCFTPYHRWRKEHSIHHGSAGDLDRRGTGDVWTMTVQEYIEASRWKKFAYRLARNPFILFVVAPLVLFVVIERFPKPNDGRRERLSVYATNAALALMITGLGFLFGWKAYLLLQLTLILIAGSAGVWLFYVQHQFEDVYWEHGADWDYEKAALEGSSYYKLPGILQWFSGNIGFHHIHHLSPRIPNYHLERCHHAEPIFRAVKPVTLFSSLRCFKFRLWDERTRRMVGYPSACSDGR
ncbi:MAG TPA: fatty acid desaturase [Verrucomicrobiae bacterium]|nr:fatty acid desaturase [Verrucomicrobiae bacterium]